MTGGRVYIDRAEFNKRLESRRGAPKPLKPAALTGPNRRLKPRRKAWLPWHPGYFSTDIDRRNSIRLPAKNTRPSTAVARKSGHTISRPAPR